MVIRILINLRVHLFVIKKKTIVVCVVWCGVLCTLLFPLIIFCLAMFCFVLQLLFVVDL